MPEAGLCPGGAAACDPRENSQDEELGLGANPRSQSVSNSRARAPGGLKEGLSSGPVCLLQRPLGNYLLNVMAWDGEEESG